MSNTTGATMDFKREDDEEWARRGRLNQVEEWSTTCMSGKHSMEDATDTPPHDGSRPSLLYTVAFDPPGVPGARHMAKMLGSSVVRTLFTGDMLIFQNLSEPVFLVGRQGIEEIPVETPPLEPHMLAVHARIWKSRAAESIDAERYAWVVFLDADCLCLRNIDHLLADRDGDILYQPEVGRGLAEGAFNGYLTEEEMDSLQAGARGIPASVRRDGAGAGGDGGCKPPPRWGINAGTWAVRGSCYQAVMEAWARIQKEEPVRETERRGQSAWNRLILDAAQHGWRAQPFETHEVQFPLHLDMDWKLYKDAAIVHCAGGTKLEKIQFMFGLYMQRFFYDPACMLLNVVEM